MGKVVLRWTNVLPDEVCNDPEAVVDYLRQMLAYYYEEGKQ